MLAHVRELAESRHGGYTRDSAADPDILSKAIFRWWSPWAPLDSPSAGRAPAAAGASTLPVCVRAADARPDTRRRSSSSAKQVMGSALPSPGRQSPPATPFRVIIKEPPPFPPTIHVANPTHGH